MQPLESLLLNPQTRQVLQRSITRGSHALLLIGPSGSGKHTIARAIAATSLGKNLNQLESAAYYLQIEPAEQGSVTIEQARTAQKFLQLKTTGDQAIRRVIYIDQADTMSHEAQNALLKTIEEPPEDTVIILTASHAEDLLTTVQSRVTTIPIVSPSLADTKAYYQQQGYDAAQIPAAYTIAGGATGLVLAMLDSKAEHPAKANITEAKAILSASVYERLCNVDAYAKQKDKSQRLVLALKRICRAALHNSLKSATPANADAWLLRLRRIQWAEEALGRNGNTKLVMTDLLLNI